MEKFERMILMTIYQLKQELLKNLEIIKKLNNEKEMKK